MKRLSELMDEIGFDPKGSPAVKEAFLKYLIRQTENVHVMTPTEKDLIQTHMTSVKALPVPGEQLSFAFDDKDQAG